MSGRWKTVTVEMRFLADVELICEEVPRHTLCVRSSVLDVKCKEKSIHDVLQMTVREALDVLCAASQSDVPIAGARRGGIGLSKTALDNPARLFREGRRNA